MSFNTNITPGRPPLLWSEVQEAFVKVNENFDILVATVGGGSGLTPINFETLDTSVSPTLDNLYKLGDITHRWRAVHTGEFTLGDLDNGVWLGNAQIKGIGSTVNLPANSTIGGDPLTGIGTSLIIDPEKTFFKTIEVDNNLSVVATTFGDTLNLLSGSGISLSVNSASDSIEIDNTGILSVSAGAGMTVATVSGASTVTNAGVRSLQSTTALPTGRTTGAGININGSTGDNLRITNTGVITVTAGLGITVSVDVATGEYQITNSAPVVNSFAVVQINGDAANRLIADAVSDVLNVNSAYPILLSKTPGTDTFEISLNPAHDIKGSVFGDDSTKIIDAVENKVYGGIFATTLRTSDTLIALGSLAGETNQGVNGIAIGALAGRTNQGIQSVAIGAGAANTDQGLQSIAVGNLAGSLNQGQRAIAIGSQAGGSSQGANAIAIGWLAGQAGQAAGSIVINASGVAVNGAAAGFYVDPIRNQSGTGNILQYNISTKEITYSSGIDGDITGSVFADDSTMLVDGVGGQIVGPINSFDGANSIAMTPSGVIIGGTGGASIIGAALAPVYIGGGVSGSSSGDIYIGHGTNRTLFVSNIIDTDDSSALIFEPPVTFNTDVTFENDITVAERLTVKGSRVINLTELKSVVAASVSFADFQTRIAALA